MGDANEVPASRWRDLLAREYLPYSTVLGGGVVLHAMNVFISITVLPTAVQEIGGLDYYAWSTTLFVSASIIAAALTSRIKSRWGARDTYLIALAVFTTGTVLCAAAPNIGVMNFGRAVQGLGGGMLYALAYAVIRMVFPSHIWTVAIGLITLMWGAATFLGPAVGGTFAQLGVWRMAFISLVPVSAGFMLLVLFFFSQERPTTDTHDPIPTGQILIAVLMILIVSILSTDPGLGEIAVAATATVGLSLLFVRVELRSRARLLPSATFGAAGPLSALFATIALLEIGMQAEGFVPYFLQNLHGQTPLAAGYFGALMALGWTTASVISARLTGNRADRTLIEGPTISFAGLALQVALLPTPSENPTVLALVCLGLLLVGYGIGHCFPHVATKIYAAVPEEEGDLAAGAITTVQLFAVAFGAAIAGMIANAAGLVSPGGVDGASSAAFWMCLLFSVAPATAAAIALRANSASTHPKKEIPDFDVTFVMPDPSNRHSTFKGD